MRLIDKLRICFDRINYILLWAAGCLLLFTVLAVCIEVCMRYFLGRPTLWSLELTGHALVWITFLGSAWVLESEGHVIIDFFILKVNPKAQTIINTATSILCALACLCVTWYGVKVAVDQFRTGLVSPTALALPMWPLFLIIPLSFFLLFVQFMRRACRYYQCEDTSTGVAAK